ncbi:MAG TPA: shikimate kinase [Acidobacteriaceae bacterium]
MSTATLDMPTKPKPRTDPTLAGRAAPAERVALDRLVFTGFMGSGKTSVGSIIADRLGWRFLDLDHEIELRHNRTVPQIFAESGEAHFRHLESATLASLLGQRHVVLALGGGAPEELGNRLLLEQTPHTAVVYLSAPFATLLDRCNEQAIDPAATARPNLADLTAAERRFHLRRTHYERIAAHTIDTSSLSLEETADAVLELLRAVDQ